MTRIAISYRRTDSAAITGRIFDRLTLRYGEDAVFMDIDNIPVGTDFRRHIEKVLADSDILVAVIGTRWRGTDRIRIMEKSDPVRVEIEMSQQFGLAVVPVLVDGARMPSADELPESLTDFAYINAAVVDSGVDFRQHIERLCRSLDRIIAQRAEDAHAAAAFTFPLPDASPLPEDAPTPETATPDASAVQEMPTPPDVSAWRDAAPWVEEPAVNDQPDIEQQPHETEYTHDDGPERRTRILRWAVRLGGVVALALLLIFTMPDFFAGSDPGPSPVIQADTQPTKVAPPPPLPVRRNKTLSEHIVQIAIVNSEELAQTSYRDLRTRYPRLLADRSAYILEDPWRISSQLPAFQILIGSFDSAESAIAFCRKYTAAGGAECRLEGEPGASAPEVPPLNRASSGSPGWFSVLLLDSRIEEAVQKTYRTLRFRYPLLAQHSAFIWPGIGPQRPTSLNRRWTYPNDSFWIGPFASSEAATAFCTELKVATTDRCTAQNVPSSSASSPAPPPQNPSPAETAPLPVRVSPLPAGSFVYLPNGRSETNESEAQAAYRELRSKHRSLLEGRPALIWRISWANGRVFFVMLVGPFESPASASAFCANLKLANGECTTNLPDDVFAPSQPPGTPPSVPPGAPLPVRVSPLPRGWTLQVSAQKSEADAQGSYRALRSRYPQIAKYPAYIYRADLGDRGTFFRVLLGPFESADAANTACTDLKSAGGSCVVQRN